MPAMSAVMFTSTRSSGAGSAENLGVSSTGHSVPYQGPPNADTGRLGAHSRWPTRPWCTVPVLAASRSSRNVVQTSPPFSKHRRRVPVHGVPVRRRGALFDEGVREARELTVRPSDRLNQLAFFNGMPMVGEVTGALSDELIDSLPPAVEAAARDARSHCRAVRVEHPAAELQVLPQDFAQAGTGWQLPSGDTRAGPGSARSCATKPTR
jgi:hypothetical protein